MKQGSTHISMLSVLLIVVGLLVVIVGPQLVNTEVLTGTFAAGNAFGKHKKSPVPIPTPQPSVAPTPLPTSPPTNSNSQKMRILEIRYFPKGETDVIYHPNTLSTQLQGYLNKATKFHGFSNPNAVSAITPEVVKVINRYKARPNVDNNWGTTYNMILEEDNICQQIHDLDIDQVWLWVDPRDGYDPNPGVEFAISSPHFQNGVQYATIATPPFCNGRDSFVIMGFDDTRTADLALHSFGHLLEGMLGNLQTIDLFWYRFGGNNAAGYPLKERCGNVHFPPNGTQDYDYANQTQVTSSCENWNPELTGAKQTFNCTKWNCNQGDYLVWWMQNMPNTNSAVTYLGKQLPNWFDFVVDFDEKYSFYKNQTQYFMNSDFLSRNP
jgi:hypothetical protein